MFLAEQPRFHFKTLAGLIDDLPIIKTESIATEIAIGLSK